MAGEADIEAAFLVLVRFRTTALLRTAMLLTGDRGQAEDLVQESLLAAYRKRHRVREISALEQYVRTTMLRTQLNWARRRSSQERPTAHIEAQSVLPVEHDDMWVALATLAPRQRAVVVLAYYEDLTDATIAEVLDISIGAVKSHRARALNHLRALLTVHQDTR